MRRRVVGDLGLVLALALAVVAALPFLLRPGLPRDTDAELHVFRAAEVSASWRAGVLYPRWAPDFYYGYGSPLFNFYAMLPYWIAEIFMLVGVSALWALKLTCLLGFLLAGTGMFLFARKLWGPVGGVASAALYLFSPYLLLDVYVRSSLGEVYSFAWIPFILFFFLRGLDGSRRSMVLGMM